MIRLVPQTKDKSRMEMIPSLVSEVSEDLICITRNVIPALQKEHLFQIIDTLPYGLFTTDGEVSII